MNNRTLFALLAGWFALGASLSAQIAPAPAAPTAARSTGIAAETVHLNPFVVGSDRSDSYNALNTNSITRFRTELKTIPISADIFTGSTRWLLQSSRAGGSNRRCGAPLERLGDPGIPTQYWADSRPDLANLNGTTSETPSGCPPAVAPEAAAKQYRAAD